MKGVNVGCVTSRGAPSRRFPGRESDAGGSIQKVGLFKIPRKTANAVSAVIPRRSLDNISDAIVTGTRRSIAICSYSGLVAHELLEEGSRLDCTRHQFSAIPPKS